MEMTPNAVDLLQIKRETTFTWMKGMRSHLLDDGSSDPVQSFLDTIAGDTARL